MTDFGMPLILVYTLLPIAFVLLSTYLFTKTEFAAYIFALMALSLISRLSEPKRNDFLKSIFNKQEYFSLRIIENLACCLPFMIFLSYERLYLIAMVLGLFSIVTGLFNYSANTNFTIPTPFGKNPFEFTVGFRKTYFLFPIVYFLTFMSISIDNFNLGIFSLILLGLICLSYYSKPENEYYVWSFKASSKKYLLEKIKISITYFTLLSLPIVIALLLFYFDNFAIVLGFYLLCFIYLASIVLAKYSAYPREMNIPQGILFALSLIFPPILIGVIPYFYTLSLKNLKPILNDPN